MNNVDFTDIRNSLIDAASSLEGDDFEGVLTVKVGALESFGDVYLGRKLNNSLLLMTKNDGLRPDHQALANIRVYAHIFTQANIDSNEPAEYIVFESLDQNLDGDFIDVLTGVIFTIVNDAIGLPLARALYETFLNWSRLFMRKAKEELSRAQAAGVFAELLTVVEIVERLKLESLEFWRGPKGEPHDISFRNHDLEIKAVTSEVVSKVQINGINQLRAFPGKDLFLAVFQVRDFEGGISLASLVGRLRRERITSEQIFDLLASVGVLPNSRWWSHEFSVDSQYLFDVGASFPKITQENIVGDFNVELIDQLSYSITIAGNQNIASAGVVKKWLEIIDAGS